MADSQAFQQVSDIAFWHGLCIIILIHFMLIVCVLVLIPLVYLFYVVLRGLTTALLWLTRRTRSRTKIQIIGTALNESADSITSDTPTSRKTSLLWRLLCAIIRNLVLPYWIAACVALGVALPVVICSVGFTLLLLREIISRSVTMLLCSFSFRSDSDSAVYPRYSFAPSASALLRLPPELRRQIWQEWLGTRTRQLYFDCAHHQGSPTLVACEVNEVYPYELFRGRQKHIDWKILSACRQIYSEIDHLMYTTQTFAVSNDIDLVRFTSNLTVVRRRNLRELRLFIRNDYFRPVRNTRYEGTYSQSSLTWKALAVKHSIESLPSLHRLSLKVRVYADGNKYLAQGVYQLLKNVQVLEQVEVTIRLNVINAKLRMSTIVWPCGHRKEFANAVWTRLNDTNAQIRKEIESEIQPKYTLSFEEYDRAS